MVFPSILFDLYHRRAGSRSGLTKLELFSKKSLHRSRLLPGTTPSTLYYIGFFPDCKGRSGKNLCLWLLPIDKVG